MIWAKQIKALIASTAIVCGVASTTPAIAQGRTPDFSRSLTINLGFQGRVLWVDATANLDKITNTEGVRNLVAHAKKANITTIVLDVKPVSGEVLYASKLAKPLLQWRGKSYPQFDSLAAFIPECRKAGIEIYASLNILSEGHKYFDVGLVYNEKRDWQSITYVVDRYLSANASQLPIRAAEDPEDTRKTTVFKDDYVQEPLTQPGQSLAVSLDNDKRVAGVIDPALLGDEPLTAPEDGNLLIVSGDAQQWVSRNLKAGRQARFTSVDARKPITEAATEKITAFINPLHPEARRYEIALLTEVVKNYDVDGIVLDRCRYSSIYNDYSDLTRQSFEQWLGKRVANWPQDILKFDTVPGKPYRRGPLFKPWLEFRARIIRDLVREIAETIRAAKPGIKLGAYVGSWFSEYYGVGVNWGSEKFPVRTGWAQPTYNEAGYAEFLDWICTGCYYPFAYRSDARASKRSSAGSVEAAAELSSIVVANSIPVYAGLDVTKYKDNKEEFAKAVNVAVNKSHGVMIFDTVYIDSYGWWDVLEQAFAQPMQPPHRFPALLSQIRAVQDAIRAPMDSRNASAPLPVVPGLPGGG